MGGKWLFVVNMDIQYGSSSSAYNRLHDVDCSSGDLSSGPTGPSGPPGSSRRELNAFLLRDYAFIRRRPIAGRSAKRSIASTMVRQLANSAQVEMKFGSIFWLLKCLLSNSYSSILP